MKFNMKEELNGKVVVIETPQRLEGFTSIDFREAIIDLVEKGNYNIVVDMSKTDFIDSNGISSLVSRISVTRSNNGDVRIASTSPTTKDVLEVTHIDKVIKSYENVKSAVDSFKK